MKNPALDYGAYLDAVAGAFPHGNIDFASLIKLYGTPPDGEKRYSPPECIGCRKERWQGDPDPKHISTSFVERQNLTMRMHMRRFTRLTSAFSKEFETHAHAVAIHFMYYDFVRIHKTLRITPAMAAGVTVGYGSLKTLLGRRGNRCQFRSIQRSERCCCAILQPVSKSQK